MTSKRGEKPTQPNNEPTISPELREIISKLLLSSDRDQIGELVDYLKSKEQTECKLF